MTTTASINCVLSPDTAHRLSRLLGMCGSAHDGEVVNAARLADRLVRERGLTWWQVILPTPTPTPVPPKREPETPPEWRQLAAWIDRNFADRLTARERQFIGTMRLWQGAPTAKQQKWLTNIAERFRESAA